LWQRSFSRTLGLITLPKRELKLSSGSGTLSNCHTGLSEPPVTMKLIKTEAKMDVQQLEFVFKSTLNSYFMM
jgi:hypothetical protein